MFVELLQYGLMGLSAIMLVLSWRITNAEQRRKNQPRPELLRHARDFMFFCLVLTVLNGALQAFDHWRKSQSQDLDVARKELADKAEKLDTEKRRTSSLTTHVRNHRTAL